MQLIIDFLLISDPHILFLNLEGVGRDSGTDVWSELSRMAVPVRRRTQTNRMTRGLIDFFPDQPTNRRRRESLSSDVTVHAQPEVELEPELQHTAKGLKINLPTTRRSRSYRQVTGVVSEEFVAAHEVPRSRSVATNIMQQSHLGNYETRAVIPPLKDVEDMMRSVETLVLARRGQRRQDHLSGLTKQFLVWCQRLPPETSIFDWGVKIVWFIEAKREAGLISVSTAWKYAGDLKQSLLEGGYPIPDAEVVQAARASYTRAGAGKPDHQALPATRDDVWKAAERATPLEAIGLKLAWKTASRIGEMEHLRREHVRNLKDHLWEITFPTHKGDPGCLGVACVVDLSKEEDLALHEEMCRRIRTMNATTKFTDITTARAAALLQAINPELSAHSIKRGALMTCLRAGVPLSVIKVLAKHQDIQTLMLYLPRGEVAMAMGLHEATRCL